MNGCLQGSMEEAPIQRNSQAPHSAKQHSAGDPRGNYQEIRDNGRANHHSHHNPSEDAVDYRGCDPYKKHAARYAEVGSTVSSSCSTTHLALTPSLEHGTRHARESPREPFHSSHLPDPNEIPDLRTSAPEIRLSARAMVSPGRIVAQVSHDWGSIPFGTGVCALVNNTWNRAAAGNGFEQSVFIENISVQTAVGWRWRAWPAVVSQPQIVCGNKPWDPRIRPDDGLPFLAGKKRLKAKFDVGLRARSL
jgi:hypothetical protein